MQVLERNYQGILIRFADRAIQVRNDEALREFLATPAEINSLELADYILAVYRQQFGKELRISRDSLAIEILGHVFVDKLAGVIKAVKKKTAIIDIGEREVDPNRFVWDDLVPLKAMIFAALGKNA